MEDGGFPEGKLGERRGDALLIGVILSDLRIEGVLVSHIIVDGLDATDKLIEMIGGEKGQIDLIMLASISYGGFNLVDPIQTYDRLKIPVVVVNPKEPDNIAVRRALIRHFTDWRERLVIIEKVGKPHRLGLGPGRFLYFHAIGLPQSEAVELIRGMVVFGNRPEPLRIAHMLAHGLSRGDHVSP